MGWTSYHTHLHTVLLRGEVGHQPGHLLAHPPGGQLVVVVGVVVVVAMVMMFLFVKVTRLLLNEPEKIIIKKRLTWHSSTGFSPITETVFSLHSGFPYICLCISYFNFLNSYNFIPPPRRSHSRQWCRALWAPSCSPSRAAPWSPALAASPHLTHSDPQ